MPKIAAERIVRHLEQARYVVMKKPPIGGRRQSWRQDSRTLRRVPILRRVVRGGGHGARDHNPRRVSFATMCLHAVQ
jgi:hypothetical protein